MTILVMAHAMLVKLGTMNCLILNISETMTIFIIIVVMNAMILKDMKAIKEGTKWRKILVT